VKVTIDGVEYVRKEKPEPRTGKYLKADGRYTICVINNCRFREDPVCKGIPNIVDADGKIIGYVSIASGEVSIE